MIYYEISFPLTLIFKYNFVKILLLMTFISISISLKTLKFLENKSNVFEISDCTITVHDDLIIMNLKFKTQQRYHIKSKHFKLKKYKLD